VVQCANSIQIDETNAREEQKREEAGKIDHSELGQHFPHFIWVLRDFALQLQDAQGRPISSQQYLESALEEQADTPNSYRDESDDTNADKNRIREVLRSVFPSRSCACLVRPIGDEKKLQKLHTIPWKELRPQFRQQMDLLRSQVIGSTEGPGVKRVNGAAVTGAGLVGLAQAYCNSINAGSVPTIYSAWQAVRLLEGERAVSKASSILHGLLNGLSSSYPDGLSELQLDGQLRAALNTAITALRATALGSEEEVQALEQSFRERSKQALTVAIQDNATRSAVACRKLASAVLNSNEAFKKLASAAVPLSLSPGKSLSASSSPSAHSQAKAEAKYKDRVSAVLQSLQDNYFRSASGPAAEETFRALLIDKCSALLAGSHSALQAATRQTSQLEDEVASLQNQEARSKAEAEAASARADRVEQSKEKREKEMQAAKAESDSLQQDVISLREALAASQRVLSEYEEQHSSMAAAAEEQFAEMQQQLLAKDAFSHRLQDQVEALAQQVEELEAEALSKGRVVRSMEVSKEEAIVAQQTAAAAHAEEAAKREALIAKLQQEVDRLSSSSSALLQRCITAEQAAAAAADLTTSRLAESQKLSQAAEKRAEALASEVAALEEELQQAEKSFQERLLAHTNDLTRENSYLTQQLGDVERLKQLESELGYDLGQLSRQNKHLQGQFSLEQQSWVQEKEKRESLVAHLRSQLAALQADNTGLSVKLTNLEADNSALHRQLSQAGKEKEQLTVASSADKQTLLARLQATEEENADNSRVIIELKDKLKRAQTALTRTPAFSLSKPSFRGGVWKGTMGAFNLNSSANNSSFRTPARYSPSAGKSAAAAAAAVSTPNRFSPPTALSPASGSQRKGGRGGGEEGKVAYSGHKKHRSPLTQQIYEEGQDLNTTLEQLHQMEEELARRNKDRRQNSKNFSHFTMPAAAQQVDTQRTSQYERWTPSKATLGFQLKLSGAASEDDSAAALSE